MNEQVKQRMRAEGLLIVLKTLFLTLIPLFIKMALDGDLVVSFEKLAGWSAALLLGLFVTETLYQSVSSKRKRYQFRRFCHHVHSINPFRRSERVCFRRIPRKIWSLRSFACRVPPFENKRARNGCRSSKTTRKSSWKNIGMRS